MRYINGGDPTPRAEIADEILPAWLAHYQQWDRQGFFAAEVDGEFVGWFHLRPAMHTHVGEDGVLELGYRLHRTAWGRGYAAEGSRALVDLAFGELGTQMVVADTMAVNTASRRVMEKSGLRSHHEPSARTGRFRSRATSTATSSTQSRVTSGSRTVRAEMFLRHALTIGLADSPNARSENACSVSTS